MTRFGVLSRRTPTSNFGDPNDARCGWFLRETSLGEALYIAPYNVDILDVLDSHLVRGWEPISLIAQSEHFSQWVVKKSNYEDF